jgi:hypothetical protein
MVYDNPRSSIINESRLLYDGSSQTVEQLIINDADQQPVAVCQSLTEKNESKDQGTQTIFSGIEIATQTMTVPVCFDDKCCVQTENLATPGMRRQAYNNYHGYHKTQTPPKKRKEMKQLRGKILQLGEKNDQLHEEKSFAVKRAKNHI